jgi:hypothetical protein
MIEHVFDPANNLSAVTVRVDPGVIYLGPINFFNLRCVDAIELSPIQASLLILSLQKAVEIELKLSESREDFSSRNGDEFL